MANRRTAAEGLADADRFYRSLQALRGFIGQSQISALGECYKSEEREFFLDKLDEYAKRVSEMPATYDSDQREGMAVAYLHYFTPSADFWITEKDAAATLAEGHAQAFGLADIGYGGELGYISLPEILDCGAELDLYWTPKTLAELKVARCV